MQHAQQERPFCLQQYFNWQQIIYKFYEDIHMFKLSKSTKLMQRDQGHVNYMVSHKGKQ